MQIDYEKYARIFKVMSDPKRLKIIDMLSGGELCACKILEEFHITQPTLSHDMKLMCDLGIVKARKEGKWMQYSLDLDVMNEVYKTVGRLMIPYISRLFKRQKGVSPNEYVTKYRIEKAKKLIEENNDLRIKDIADAVGFKESYYFSKTFKRETGMWPTEYSARDK